jgi:hypothetical protein
VTAAVRTRAALVCAALLLPASSARAGGEVRTAVSVDVPAITASAFAAQVERDLGRRKLSLALGAGLRSAAMGDYGSFTFGGSAELRRWLRAPMRGWFAALRLELARTAVEHELEDRTIGALLTTSLALSGGHRFVPYRRLEITPSIGAAFIREAGLDGRSPPSTRWAPTLGLTVGWMF